MDFEKVSVYFLFAICIATIILILPTINNNIDNPNLIIYFNADEGYQMEVIWSYYSGEAKPYHQMSLDYGLEQLYLSDLSRIIFSKFIDFKPGSFVLILRWFHLFSWISALIALWYLVSYHFGKGWLPTLAVLLLAVRPAFAYLSNGIKPDPLVLFFIIVGLNYTLRIVEKPGMKYLLLPILCASLAFIVKFAGVFLLPAIIAAIYFGYQYQTTVNKDFSASYLRIKNPWIFPFLISLGLIIAPFVAIFFYVRKTTGLTHYKEFGFLGSLLREKIIFFFWFAGAIFMLTSFVILFLSKSKNYFVAKVMRKINEINSFAIIVMGLFLIFTLLFGFRWLVNPGHFLDIYVYHVREFSGGDMLGNIHTLANFLNVFLTSLIYKLKSFDILVLLVFGVYLITEYHYYLQNLNTNKLQLYKRLVLFVFLMPFFLSMLSIGRFEQFHMLPFFAAAVVLAIQGVNILIDKFNDRKLIKKVVITLVSAVFIIDIGLNGASVIKSRTYQFNQKEDVAFVVEEWLSDNIPLDTLIVAEHPSSVYIPPEYKNIKIFNRFLPDGIEQLRHLVNTYRPKLIYYNAGPCGHVAMPPIEEMLPGKKVKLIQSLDSTARQYQRKKGDKFVIYEVLY